MAAQSSQSEPIAGASDLLAVFRDAEKPRSRFRVGTEAEKFGVFVADGSPVPFAGERSIGTVFDALIQSHGWFAEREHAAGEVISLRRGDSSITLEPGGQLELSGAPLETVHQTCAEFRGHLAELRDISSELGIAWLGIGYQPFTVPAAMPKVPKLRYGVMREYLPTRGSLALDMMACTATVQANFDYSSEADAMRKLRLALRLSPIVTAMFANSPLRDGHVTGDRSIRARVWLDTDPDRAGLLPFAWRDDVGYQEYVAWALDVPMFLVRREERILHNTGQTFRAFLRDGFEGERATHADWQTHLNTVFPEVRLKNTLEVRGADGQGTTLLCALPALWKGILYCEQSMDEAERLTVELGHDELEGCRANLARDALGAKLLDRPLLHWARDLCAIASEGLRRLSHLNRNGRDERIHLATLEELLATGETPADRLAHSLEGSRNFTADVIRLTQL